MDNEVFIIQVDERAAGYYSLVELKEDTVVAGITLPRGYMLDHMFVLPEFMGQGLGTALFNHLKLTCRQKAIRQLGILADPHARGFYEKLGCQYCGEIPSTIPGRTTPRFIYSSSDS